MPVDPSNNISGFVNAFAGGGVRTNLFVVNGTIPGYSDNRAISFLCKAAQIPRLVIDHYLGCKHGITLCI